MALSNARKVVAGETPHAHEKEALDFAYSVLPDSDPFQAWALTELLEPGTGRLYELDLIVLGYSAIYLVEIKSGPGRYEGDHHEWWRTPPEQNRPLYMDGPLSLCNHKAKVLKSRLQSKMKQPGHCPFIQPLIFLSATDLDLRLKPEGRLGVVTRKDFLQAVQHHKFEGAPANWRAERIDKTVAHDIAQALSALGLRPRKGSAYAGSYELGAIISESPGTQDRVAKHRDRGFLTRARVYLVPQQASLDRRNQLRRAAERESTLLWDVREHPYILRIVDYVADAPLGPTVVFDDFAGGVPLDAFLRQNPNLGFDERVTIIEHVGRALAHCHRKEIYHGGLAPQSVLVRRHPDTNAIDVRVFNFQLGVGREVEVTQHWSALAQEGWAVYQAPELRDNPGARSVESDLFSLGALAYLAFTGRAPAEHVEEMDKRLGANRSLDPCAADDTLPQWMTEVFLFATDVAPVNRSDDVGYWLELLLEKVTAPEEKPVADEVDPLEAAKGMKLGELEVLGVLGVGATARVLRVHRAADDRTLALKISLDSNLDARLEEEAALLRSLPKHPRIVDLLGAPVIKGRKCLLLSLAGAMTLQAKLTRFGSVSVEEASRYGDDLLLALEHLEEHQILHRDIKPANLGVGTVSKSVDHLTLFDFSLARLPVSEIQVGTAVYRDPYLRVEGRGGWDFAADRWSAAMTLHEMLTGSRPSFSGGSAIDADARMVLATERLEASVREELVQFFEKAFTRAPSDRFKSANEMRHAWVSIVGAPARSSKTKAKFMALQEPELRELTDDEIVLIDREAPIAGLPLSLRARNALDRAGLMRTEDLLGLAANRLSAIRGVGRQVTKEILDFRDRWRTLRLAGTTGAELFFPGYGGDDLPVDRIGLDTTASEGLAGAGLASLRALASSPTAQVEALAKRHGIPVENLRKALSTENARANERAQPTTLEGWIDAFIPPRKGRKERHLVRALYGLEPPLEGRLDATVRELAEKEDKTAPAVYIALGKAKDDWVAHPALPDLRERINAVLGAAGGAGPLVNLADDLARSLPHAGEPSAVRAMAAALFRVVVEVDKTAPSAPRLARIPEREPWIVESDEYASVLRRLGEMADTLAARPTIASTGEVRRAFQEIVEGTPLLTVKEERLFELAAAASKNAASSSRLEIYPRKLDPKRAIELCAATFRGGVTVADVRSRVALRYPEAGAIPDRPMLDGLLAPLSFVWDPISNQFLRAGDHAATSVATRNVPTGRAPTALPNQARAMDADAIDARQFEEKLKHALEMNAFRVLGVTADRSRKAALSLKDRLGARMVPLDVELAKEVAAEMKRANIKDAGVVYSADREGPAGEHWQNLLRLVRPAADTLLARLKATKEPLLLVQPGLLARYGLSEFLTKLIAPGEIREGGAIFLLVPTHDTGGMPRINGTLAIPGVLAGQVAWIPHAWLSNRHNAAA